MEIKLKTFEDAASKASQKAAVLAKTLDGTVGSIVSIEEIPQKTTSSDYFAVVAERPRMQESKAYYVPKITTEVIVKCVFELKKQ